MNHESQKDRVEETEEDASPVEVALDETLPQDAPVRRRLAARRLLRAEVYYAAALTAFALLTLFVYYNPYLRWDEQAIQLLQSTPGLFEFMRLVSVPGDGWIPHIITTATVFAFLLLRRFSEAAALALSAGGGGLLSRSFKLLIGRPRPPRHLVEVFREINSNSFPSGHVTFYVCYFGFLFFVAYAILPRGSVRRRVALVVTGLPVLLVGLSRVYLGEHWPSDTLGAYLMSGIWLAFCLDLYRRWKKRGAGTTEAGLEKN
jgi:membrane-associated phospholipid phosphatase